jgi:DNA-binding NarL/FixJ family response regulator
MSARSVLLVEDETTGRELLARGLARAGFEVVAAADGSDAQDQLGREFDFVVTDLLMPRIDGLQLLKELNRLGHRSLRVVITSFADKERVVAVLNLGADYLLEKPFGVGQLAEVLAKLERERGIGDDRLGRFFERRLLGLPLTPREREFIALVLRGDSNKQIARKLALSEQTVKNALSHAYKSLDVQSRGELFHRVFPV